MRKPRIHVPGAYYHVTLRGNHRQDIFFCDGDRQLLGQYVAQAREQVGVRIHAYCWMTNHIHMLIQVADKPLGAFVQRIGTRYARTVQARLPTTGHLFENRYHALLVDVDRYFLGLLRYIHLNPVRAGLVDTPTDYPWSSHRAYLGRAGHDWLETDFGLRMFDPDPRRARRRYRCFVSQDCEGPDDPHWLVPSAGEPRVLGDADFLRTIARMDAPTAAGVRGLEDIAREVGAELGVTLAELQSSSRQRRLARARGLLAARACASGAATLSEIARFLNRSASAVTRAAENYRSGTC